ncbi:universal stress protein, partial [Mesorhizobium sp.]
MSYKDILVFLDGSTDNDARMEFAFSLARAHGARLTGVDVDAAAAFEGEWAERAKSLAETFHAGANRSDVRVRYKIADRDAAGWKDFYAHYADLLIATQPNQEAFGRVLSG